MRISFFAVLTAFLIWNCSDKPPQPLTIAVAANMQFAMTELKPAFEAKTGIPLSLVSASSGKLSAQINQGAPYHVFVSADTKYPDSLFKTGKAAHKPRIYAYGSLVLWTLRSDLDLSKGLAVLAQQQVQKIALANPKTAPYGVQAMRALQTAGLLERVQSQLVFGESVGQASQYILSGACDIGFTAKSAVLAPEMAKKGHWVDVSQSLYTPIAQAAVITDFGQSMQQEASRQFLNFLFSPEASQIFKRYGYKLP